MFVWVYFKIAKHTHTHTQKEIRFVAAVFSYSPLPLPEFVVITLTALCSFAVFNSAGCQKFSLSEDIAVVVVIFIIVFAVFQLIIL